MQHNRHRTINTVEQLLPITHMRISTHTHMHKQGSATLAVILCCCHSNHLTFPSQSRPNETTGGQRERERGSGGEMQTLRKQRYIAGKIGSMEAVLPLFCICSLQTSLHWRARILPETKATAPLATSAVCSWPSLVGLPVHFHINPITLSLIDNYPALHDLWPQTQIKIQLR